MVWLTPDLDALFRGPAGDRRRFLDRLVLAVDAGHGARVNAMERALRSRNRLPGGAPDDGPWLDAVEREVAELAVAVALARRETVERLDSLILSTRDEASPFPWPGCGSRATSTTSWRSGPRSMPRTATARPCARTAFATAPPAGRSPAPRLRPRGPPRPQGRARRHRLDREQKALLIGLVLAHARLVTGMSGLAPLVLLDEVAAHLDPRRRAGLFDALEALPGQVWMTGADPALFGELGGRADMVQVAEGSIRAETRNVAQLQAQSPLNSS